MTDAATQGTAMLEVEKRESQEQKRIAWMVILSDFASNNGVMSPERTSGCKPA